MNSLANKQTKENVITKTIVQLFANINKNPFIKNKIAPRLNV